MPLYEIFCLARPALKKPELHEIIKRSCQTVLAANGVVTDVTVNGLIPLAYTIRKVHGHYDQVRSAAYKLSRLGHVLPPSARCVSPCCHSSAAVLAALPTPIIWLLLQRR